jgi:hypothetical protein
MSFLFLEIVIFEISVALFFFYTQIDPIWIQQIFCPYVVIFFICPKTRFFRDLFLKKYFGSNFW